MSYNTIKLKKYLDIVEEYPANAAIYPGMLIELMSTGYVRAHATAGGNVLPMVALEDELQGKGIDDAFAQYDRVQCWIPQRGEIAYMILADGENASIGDFLESNGAGYLQVHVADTESFESAEAGEITVYPLQIVAIALEALDRSGSDEDSSSPLGGDKRIKVRIV